MDYKKNLLYFIGTGSDELMLAGLVVLLFGVFGVVGFKSIAVVIIPVVGFAMVCLGVQRWPVSDSDYDNSVKGYISNLKPQALNKLGVDESEVSEVPPIILSGYDFGEDVEKVKQGDDGRWRSNIYKVILLFFSHHELHGYTLKFNTLRDARNEGTDVYFYQDIVSVSTLSKTVEAKVDGKEIKVKNIETFEITTKGGTSLTVNLSDSSQGEESVNAMRALLREKKQG